jgi:hypothetical protein
VENLGLIGSQRGKGNVERSDKNYPVGVEMREGRRKVTKVNRFNLN